MPEIKIPTINQEPNFKKLKEVCEDYMKFLRSEEYHSDNDFDHFIYEAAMEAFYGKDVWKYINWRDA